MRLLTLGGLTLEGTRLRPSKPLLLLTFLSLEGLKDRRFLAELFWLGAADPLNSLSTALTHLRKVVPGAVEADETHVRSTLTSDVGELLSVLDEGDWERGLELYAGRFLDGIYLRAWSAELEEWVYATREFLAGRMREALLRLAEAEASRRHFEAAARRAETAYLLSGAPEPEVDDLRRLYTLLTAGRSVRAAEVRKEAESFGIALDLTVKEAEGCLSRVVSERSTPHNLPVSATSFVGREAELTELAELFKQPDCRLLTVTGPGGVGKSRLALQLARRELEASTGETQLYFVALEDITSPEAIPTSLATAAGIPLAGQEDALTQVLRSFGSRRLLIVLDNYEHLTKGTTYASRLIESCPNLKLIVTSRKRLHLIEEWVCELEGLPFPASEEVPLERARYFDAVQLFTQRARRASNRFVLTNENIASVVKICRLLEGSPLGIELAAVWVRIMSPEEITREIEKNLDFLTAPTRNTPDRHQSLRATFEYSWSLLSPREQEALRKLAVFRGGFRREAVAEVAGVTIPVLASLLDKSLLKVLMLPNSRYGLHFLLHQYAQEKLLEHPEEQMTVRGRHAEYYHRFLRQRGGDLRGPKQKGAMAAIEEELGNLRSAWQWAVTTLDLDDLQQSVRPLMAFFDKRAHLQEAVEMLAQAADALSESDPSHRSVLGNVMVERAWFELALGKTEAAALLAERGVKLLRPARDENGLWTGLVTLGSIARHGGDYLRAKEYFEELLALARAARKDESLAGALNNLAVVEEQLGNYDLAGRYYREALTLNRRRGDFERIVKNLNNLGRMSLLTDGPQKALPILQEALILAREIGYQQAVPHLLLSQAEAALILDEHAGARTLCHEALAVARKGGDLAKQAEALLLLGRVASALNKDTQAHDHLVRGLAVARSIKATPLQLESLFRLAELWIKQGRDDRASGRLALVSKHPATGRWIQKQARQLLAELQGRFPAAAVGKQDPGGAPTLEEVVEKILSPESAENG